MVRFKLPVSPATTAIFPLFISGIYNSLLYTAIECCKVVLVRYGASVMVFVHKDTKLTSSSGSRIPDKSKESVVNISQPLLLYSRYSAMVLIVQTLTNNP